MNPEMCTLEGRRIYCPCKSRNQSMWLTCTSRGELDVEGACLKCWACGRVITHDGVVIARTTVKA